MDYVTQPTSAVVGLSLIEAFLCYLRCLCGASVFPRAETPLDPKPGVIGCKFGKGFSTGAHKPSGAIFSCKWPGFAWNRPVGEKKLMSHFDQPATQLLNFADFARNNHHRNLVSISRNNNHNTFEMSTAELATSYAALILADDNVEITVRLHPTACLPMPRCCCPAI